MDRIGTIEILRQRVYPLNAESRDEVVVEPGVFNLYRDGGVTFWVMSGRINERFENLGGGMFLLHNGDRPSGRKVKFTSKRFTPDEWTDLLTEPGFTEGHPEQRLRVTLTTTETGK